MRAIAISEIGGDEHYFLTLDHTGDDEGKIIAYRLLRATPSEKDWCMQLNGMPGLLLMKSTPVTVPTSSKCREVFIAMRSIFTNSVFIFREGMIDIFWVRTIQVLLMLSFRFNFRDSS